ncbi:MAG TPA: hypothetical protein VFD24_15650 [Chitinophagaceae bacterium]|jgi:hypothetical protein|nr:hypothetical protein [Chitinophagaceae bacterium]
MKTTNHIAGTDDRRKVILADWDKLAFGRLWEKMAGWKEGRGPQSGAE